MNDFDEQLMELAERKATIKELKRLNQTYKTIDIEELNNALNDEDRDGEG